MPCYRPVTAFKPLDGGAISFRELKGHREINIPCGRCIGCRIQKQEAWAFRCYAESKLHRSNAFITLTYDNDNLPKDLSLDHREWQLFAKRLRKRLGPFRFFMCGEYGDNTKRPHYHALLFGVEFPDAIKCNSVYSHSDLYQSAILSDAWGKGFCSIGEVSYASARYVAAYTIKSCTDDVLASRYSVVDDATGEIINRASPYGRMSLKPGIGSGWFEKYWPEVAAHDAVFMQDKKVKIPVYFDTMFSKIAPDDFDASKHRRCAVATKFIDNNTRDRLEVREQIVHAKRKFDKQRFPNAL